MTARSPFRIQDEKPIGLVREAGRHDIRAFEMCKQLREGFGLSGEL